MIGQISFTGTLSNSTVDAPPEETTIADIREELNLAILDSRWLLAPLSMIVNGKGWYQKELNYSMHPI